MIFCKYEKNVYKKMLISKKGLKGRYSIILYSFKNCY